MKWISVRDAAVVLGFATISLRRLIERNARRAPDGSVEALVDGVRAKKLGRTWRVQLGERWAGITPSHAK
jgi:hypothetical protein